MKLRKFKRGIYHVYFPSLQKMGSTVMRFEEHYENPKFRGKIFSREEFREWYVKTYGKFTYCSDWHGYNIPWYVFEPFKRGLFPKLTPEEIRLLKLVGNIKEEKFYIIATGKGSGEGTFKHEFCHGLYATCLPYKILSICTLLLLGTDLKTMFNYLVASKKYHWKVFLDESQAYLCADSKFLRKTEKIPTDKWNYKLTSFLLNKLYNYFK